MKNNVRTIDAERESPDIWTVRADFGRHTQGFVEGGFAGIGWLHDCDLTDVTTKEELYPLYTSAHPEDTSSVVVGQQVGQIARFLLEIKPGDVVITPAAEPEWLYYGFVKENPHYYYVQPGSDSVRYAHRRPVQWHPEPMRRTSFSVPFQNSMRSSLTVFRVWHQEEFLRVIGVISGKRQPQKYDPYDAVLTQLLELDAREFELLITALLTVLGFEESEHTGKSGDGGVDATGELDVAGMVRVKLFVQAKRYKPGIKIKASTVKGLRQSIPSGGQGAFITTADYASNARDVATEIGFPRIGLINGHQLVDLLMEHWDDIPEEFQEKLGLRRGLIPL